MHPIHTVVEFFGPKPEFQYATKVILCWARPMCLVQSDCMMKYLTYFTCRIQVFWCMTLCHCVNDSWHFEGTWCGYLQELAVHLHPWRWSLPVQNVQSLVPTDRVPCAHWRCAIYQKPWIVRNCVFRFSNLACFISLSRNTSDLSSARMQFHYRSAYLLFCLRYRQVYSSSLWHRSWLDHLHPYAFQFIVGCHSFLHSLSYRQVKVNFSLPMLWRHTEEKRSLVPLIPNLTTEWR